MIDEILQLDRELLIFLNSLGTETFDSFWLTITNQFTWTPLFLLILYFVFKEFGVKKGIFTFLFIIVLVAFSDQFTNLIKNTTERLRPCNTENLRGYLRQFTYKPGGFSFWSGHASLSTAFSVFVYLIFKGRIKYIKWIFIFPIVFGLSRVYLGVHYPIDITCGYIAGGIVGYTFYILYRKLFEAVFK